LFELLFKFPADDYRRGELVFTGDWPGWLIAALAVGAALTIAVLLVRRRRAAGPAALAAIGVLQLAVVALVLALLAQPALRIESLRPGENAVALVLDRSESMAYGPERSRFESAREHLGDIEARLAGLGTSVQRFEFAATAAAVDAFGEAPPAGTATSIADALETVLAAARSRAVAAVVLVSDGIDTSGGLRSDELADIAAVGVPVHTLTVGREQVTEDLELTRVLVPREALPGSTLAAQVSVRHDAAGTTRIKVYDGDELLASVPVTLRPGSSTTSVSVDVAGLAAGHRRLEFAIDPLSAETELRNNRRAALVHVAEQARRILYYEGEPRWEYKFMRRAVLHDEQISLATLLAVTPNKFYRQGLDSPEQLADGFPATREELFAYDALIIGSVEAATFTPEQLDIAAGFVSERGGTLLLIAGPKGLGNGGWGQSPLAGLLPVSLPPSTEDTFVREKVRVELTPQGADLEMLRLGADAAGNGELWDGLPGIADYQRTGALKPAATPLLNAITGDGSVPLLVTQPFGRGHVYVLATGGTWRWQMRLPSDDRRHETFWRQFLRALVANAPARTAVSARPASDGLELRAEFRDAGFRPETGLDVTAVVAHDSGASLGVALAPVAGEPGVYAADAGAAEAGVWYVEAIAQRGGEVLGTARTSVYVEPGQAEYRRVRADAGLMRRLAEATGGRHLSPDGLADLPDLIRYSAAGITETVFRPVWDAPALLLLLLGLKSGEWLLRRRWGTI
jgi:uncharacterized membrane protein